MAQLEQYINYKINNTRSHWALKNKQEFQYKLFSILFQLITVWILILIASNLALITLIDLHSSAHPQLVEGLCYGFLLWQALISEQEYSCVITLSSRQSIIMATVISLSLLQYLSWQAEKPLWHPLLKAAGLFLNSKLLIKIAKPIADCQT